MKKLYVVKVSSCLQCPNKVEGNHWSSDGWDRMVDWTCSAANGKKIAGAVEWHEEKKIKIPDWCPLETEK